MSDCSSTVFLPESGCSDCTVFEARLRAVEEAIQSLIGGTKIPISITDENGQTVRVNVYGEVSS